jgi:hypothetical protein
VVLVLVPQKMGEFLVATPLPEVGPFSIWGTNASSSGQKMAGLVGCGRPSGSGESTCKPCKKMPTARSEILCS